ncbi:MAG: c-type cytochrome biogenesis protein CcmI, partial [Acidiferrobacterales bacterium]
MIIFWLIVSVMLITALVFVLPFLMGSRRVASQTSKDVNVAVYKARFTELKVDVDNGTLTQEQFEQARRELERGLLEDVAGDDEKQPAERVAVNTWGAVITALAFPLLAFGLYVTLGDSKMITLSPDMQGRMAAEQPADDTHSVEEMIAKLRDRLRQQPNNVDGWMMLGRTYVVLDRYGEAVAAYAKAHEIAGDDPAVLVDYAEALALANGNRVSARAEQMAERALTLDTNNEKALWLIGLAAAQRGDAQRAVEHWQRLHALLPEGSQEAQTMATFIARAKGEAPTVSTESPPSSSGSTTTATAAPARLQVHVALDPALAAQAKPDDTVFIFAQAAQGPRMPLAIVRSQVRGLPTTVTLDDSKAMMPAMKLSNFDEVVVGARVSKSGQATPQSGDLEGRKEALGAVPRAE